MKPIGILYEHPEWFRLLFAELERRQIAYEPILAHEHRFDPAERTAPYCLVVNRVSASSYLRGHGAAIFHARGYLEHLERIGVRVVNGTSAFGLDTSKVRQLSLLADLGLPCPRSRVVNAVSQIETAAAELEYPLIVKPNLGGSGALMQRFRYPAELRAAIRDGQLDSVLGLDATAIVQEFHPPKGGAITRVEALDGRFLYAISIETDPEQGFNICPADICLLDASGAAPAQRSLRIEVASPPRWVIEGVLEIFRAARVDVGGVEYLESERDGQIYLYDVNALSNFVTDAPRLLGFDPTARLVDFLERSAGLVEAVGAPSLSSAGRR